MNIWNGFFNATSVHAFLPHFFFSFLLNIRARKTKKIGTKRKRMAQAKPPRIIFISWSIFSRRCPIPSLYYFPFISRFILQLLWTINFCGSKWMHKWNVGGPWEGERTVIRPWCDMIMGKWIEKILWYSYEKNRENSNVQIISKKNLKCFFGIVNFIANDSMLFSRAWILLRKSVNAVHAYRRSHVQRNVHRRESAFLQKVNGSCVSAYTQPNAMA